MADMFDYLKWRGDISFSQVPVNPVDALIFSSLSYIYLADIVSDHPRQWIALSDVAREVLSLPEPESRGRVKNDLELLKAAAETVRFGRSGLTFCKDILVPEEETQFAAVTFYLDDGSVFIAFRGTDHSLTGWKEDFNMAFQESVPAQRMAVQYLKDFSAMSSVPIYVGGHSKGGNFILMEEITADSKFIDRTLKTWLAELDSEERNDFVDAVFDLLAAGDANETKEIMHPKNVISYLQTLTADDDMRKRLSGKLRLLVQAVRKNRL